jgi:hypothetical protein
VCINVWSEVLARINVWSEVLARMWKSPVIAQRDAASWFAL